MMEQGNIGDPWGAYNDLFLDLDAGYMDGFTLIIHYTRHLLSVTLL